MIKINNDRIGYCITKQSEHRSHLSAISPHTHQQIKRENSKLIEIRLYSLLKDAANKQYRRIIHIIVLIFYCLFN